MHKSCVQDISTCLDSLSRHCQRQAPLLLSSFAVGEKQHGRLFLLLPFLDLTD